MVAEIKCNVLLPYFHPGIHHALNGVELVHLALVCHDLSPVLPVYDGHPAEITGIRAVFDWFRAGLTGNCKEQP